LYICHTNVDIEVTYVSLCCIATGGAVSAFESTCQLCGWKNRILLVT